MHQGMIHTDLQDTLGKGNADMKIFISYRRAEDDKTYLVGTIHEKLAETFGKDNVLRDKNNIAGGTEWRARLDQAQVPVVVATVPHVGNVLLWAQNPLPRAIFTALFGLSLTATSVVWILRTPSKVSGQASPAPSV